ncbi:MAG TPA: response regulator, partial [Verrucomicrobiae bacterium]|nr:response regulator [Verrucomicrobiae bacterium]
RSFEKANVCNPLQVVTDGEQALCYLQGEGEYGDRRRFPMPAVVFLDLNMPKKNGFDVLTGARQNPALRGTMIYVLSASTRLIDISRAYELGANAYLIKPSRLSTLPEMMKGSCAFAAHVAGAE